MIQRSGRGGDDDTIDGSESNQQSTNIMKWRGGGLRGDEDTHTTIKQITWREGVVVVGDDDDDDDNDNDHDDNDDDDDDDDDGDGNDDDSNDNGRCGGRDGLYRMRKGRGHNNRTNTTIK